MILRDRYDGGGDPFEGNRELLLRHLPAGARIVSARATVTPVDPTNGAEPFVEVLRFQGAAGTWGATRSKTADWVEVDLGARRTLAGVQGTNLGGARMQVDLGGLFVPVGVDGTLARPGDQSFPIGATGAALPGLVVSRLKLVSAGVSPDVTSVRVRSVPSNVTLALPNRPALWFHSGELTRPETTGDLSEVLQAYLEEEAEEVDGVLLLPLVLHSDSIARLRVELEIEYLLRASVLPDGVREATLPYDHGSLPRTPGALQLSLPVGARIAATAGRVTGAFQRTIVAFGPTGEVRPAGEVSLSPGASPAQPISLPGGATGTAVLEAVAVDLLLTAIDRTVRLQIDLREDMDRKPGGKSFLPAPIPFELDREKNGGRTWVSVPLPAPFQFKPGQERTYWLVLQSLEGDALWSVEGGRPVGPVLHLTQDGGFSWRQAVRAEINPDVLLDDPSRLAGLFRLRSQPATFRMPVELQVGNGPDARRVSFTRFEAQGKVDLRLEDVPEVVLALNQVLAEPQPGACPDGEHLINGGFEDWVRRGNELGEPHAIPLYDEDKSLEEVRIAVSPDGRWAYAVSQRNESALLFQFIDLDLDEVTEEIVLETDAPRLLALHPDGSRAYVALADGTLWLFDLAERRPLGAVSLLAGRTVGAESSSFHGLLLPSSLALSPDGRHLYAAFRPRQGFTAGIDGLLALFDTALLEEAALRGEVFSSTAVLEIRELFAWSPVALAVSPDGARLYVLAAGAGKETGRNEILFLDAARLSLQGKLSVTLQTGEAFDSMALTTDGSAAVALRDDRVELIDLSSRTVRAFFSLDGEGAAVAVAPDGLRAFLVGQSGIRVLDLVRNDLGPRIDLESLSAVVVTAQGDRVLALGFQEFADEQGFVLQSFPIGDAMPAAWILTSGRVRRFRLPAPADRIVVLGSMAREEREEEGRWGPNALSQVAPVVPCPYELSFEAFATAEDSVAEILWRDASGASLRVDPLPISEIPESEHREGGGAPALLVHRERFTPPPAARQAEVRFVAWNGTLAVNSVSLRAVQSTLVNGDLRAGLKGWRQIPEDAPGFSVSSVEGGTRLRNAGLREVVLVQAITEVVPGRSFALDFDASRVPSNAAPVRLALRWLRQDGSEAAPPIFLEVGRASFGTLAAHGEVPQETVRAELILTLPAGAALEARRIDLRFAAVRDPLTATFIAQAPGELAVLDWQVIYDTVAVPLPAIPAGGLAAPTPLPGGDSGDSQSCGCGPEDAAAAIPVTMSAPSLPFQALAVNALPAADLALKKVFGIGRGRTSQLGKLGVRSLEDLAAAIPAALKQGMPGVSEEMAAGFILRAREILREG